MMTISLKTRLLTIALWLVSTHVSAQDRWDFAFSLVRNEDYFRAISVYKELGFFATDAEMLYRARVGEGLSYLLSGRTELALRPLTNALENDKKGIARFLIGLCFLQLRNLSQSDYTWGDQALPLTVLENARHLFRAIFFLAIEKIDTAKTILENITLGTILDESVIQAREIADQLRGRFKNSPFLTGGLSLLFPGLGQITTGHYVDGLQAFSFVALFGAATFGVYLYDSKYSTNFLYTGIGVSITASFHIANVIGAAKTADFSNQSAVDRILIPFEKELWKKVSNYILNDLKS